MREHLNGGYWPGGSFGKRLGICLAGVIVVVIILICWFICRHGPRDVTRTVLHRDIAIEFEAKLREGLAVSDGIDVEFVVFGPDGTGEVVVTRLGSGLGRKNLAESFRIVQELKIHGAPAIIGPSRLAVHCRAAPGSLFWFVWPNRAYVFDSTPNATITVVAVFEIDTRFMEALWKESGAMEALRGD